MPESPNVIVITTDQQRLDSLGCMRSAFIRTPNLDRLAAGGVLCRRAYSTNPVCTPARASIFSGLQVSRHGAWNVGTSIPTDIPLLSHRLRTMGYRTHSVGKMHFQPFMDPASVECYTNWTPEHPLTSGPYYGFEMVELACGHTTWGMTGAYGDWVVRQLGGDLDAFARCQMPHPVDDLDFGGQATDTDLPTRLQNSVWTAERSCAFLRDRQPDRPFFLNIGFEDPHLPHAVPCDYMNRVDPAAVPLPDYVEGELADKPPHYAGSRDGSVDRSRFRRHYPLAGVTANNDRVPEGAARRGRAYYYTLVQLIDDQVGHILDCLDTQGLADNTLVVFTTDHGEMLGDHGLWSKGPFHCEQLIHIPMIWRWPRGFAAGLNTAALMSQVDLVPTIMAAVGAPCADEVDGVDLGAVLRGEAAAARDSVLAECIDDPSGLRLKTVVTATHKLTCYCGESFGEFYDLETDPHERVNRWDDPAGAPVRAELLGRLLEYLEPNERRGPRTCYA